MNKIYIIIICFLFVGNVKSQNWIANVEAGGGFVVVHREKMKHLAQSHPNKVTLAVQKQSDGSKDWHQSYNQPKIAYTFFMVDYKNIKLGKTLGGNIQFLYPFVKKKNTIINAVIGIGAGYNTHPFDRKDNYQNNVLGSRITGSLHGKLLAEYTLSKNIGITYGIGLIHFSNGALKLPNLGINVPYTCIGINYLISEKARADEEVSNIEQTYDKINVSMAFSNGWKDVVYAGGTRHWFNVFSMKTHYNTSSINRITGGVEFFYDRSVYEFRENEGLDNAKNRNFKMGIVLGHELRLGKVYAVINYGYYVYQAYNNVYAKAYQRYQLKYKFHEYMYSAIGLKVHKGVADVLEWTVGIEL